MLFPQGGSPKNTVFEEPPIAIGFPDTIAVARGFEYCFEFVLSRKTQPYASRSLKIGILMES